MVTVNNIILKEEASTIDVDKSYSMQEETIIFLEAITCELSILYPGFYDGFKEELIQWRREIGSKCPISEEFKPIKGKFEWVKLETDFEDEMNWMNFIQLGNDDYSGNNSNNSKKNSNTSKRNTKESDDTLKLQLVQMNGEEMVPEVEKKSNRISDGMNQDQQIESISKLVKCHNEMSEKIEVREAKEEGDDKITDVIYVANQGDNRIVGMTQIKNLLTVEMNDTLDGIYHWLDMVVEEKCRHIQTRLSKLFEELQRMKKSSAALGYEKQEQDREARLMQEKCRHLQTKLSKSSKELRRVKRRSAALSYEKQEQDQEAKRMQKEREELEERLRKLEVRMIEHEEGGRRMERRATHDMMMLEELEKRIDDKIVESELLREEMKEQGRRLREKEEEGRRRQEEMKERERRMREKVEEVLVMIDENREANRRQLSMLIEYHGRNYNLLHQALNTCNGWV